MTDKDLLELAAKAAVMVSYNQDTGLIIWNRKPAEQKDAERNT